MSKNTVLTADSTCDLSPELKKRYGVSFIPYHINIGNNSYLDNVDVTSSEIFAAYRQSKLLPKTAAVSVGEYVDFFKQWINQGLEVIHICLGGAISSSYQNCRIASEMLPGVYPVDSRNLSSGTGHIVIEAANLIEQGLPAPEIAESLDALTGKVHSSFILDTLEYLAAGGRCSSVAALGANLLHLKPCIEVDNTSGGMGLGKKYRGRLDDVLVKYTRDKLSAYSNIRTERIFITSAAADPAYIELVHSVIEDTMKFDEILRTEASCTISSHCGPNTLGVLFLTK